MVEVAIIILAWLTLKEERSQKLDMYNLAVIVTCRSAMLSSKVNGPLVHGSKE